MKGLEIKDLSISTNDGTPILDKVSLPLKDNQVYALLGRNGRGKSTLVNAIMGSPAYRITHGQILLDGQDITSWTPDQRAKAGLFLAHQYPAEVPGVSYGNFLRTALVNVKGRGFVFADVLKELTSHAQQLGFTHFDYQRDLNVGFSGGEKKKSEILQMLALRPRFAFLDEPDSGLDKMSVRRLAKVLRRLDYPTTLVIISHSDQLLDALQPDATYNLEEL